MRKFFSLLAAVLAVALVASACEVDVLPYAARVNGKTISVSELNASLDSINQDAGYKCYVESQNQTTPVLGAGSDSFASGYVANQLGFLVSAEAIHQKLQALGLATNNPIALALGKSEATEQFAPQQSSGCTTAPATTAAQLIPAYRNVSIQYYADVAVLAARSVGLQLTPAGLRAYEAAHPKTTAVDCIDAVITKTQASAQNVVNQLQKGANFAAVAKANSIDAASSQAGGKVGCLNPTTLSAPLSTIVENLKIGQVSSATSFSGDWVVLEVTSHTFPSATDAAQTIVIDASSVTSFSLLLAGIVNKATVIVAPQYGSATRNRGQMQITANAGPPTKFIPNSSLLSP